MNDSNHHIWSRAMNVIYEIIEEDFESLRPITQCSYETKCSCDLIKTTNKHKDLEYVMCFLKGLGELFCSIKTKILLMDLLSSINSVFSCLATKKYHPYIKYTWIFLMKTTFETQTLPHNFIIFIENQINANFTYLSLYVVFEIIHQTSYNKIPQQNFVVERKHKYILNSIVPCMLTYLNPFGHMLPCMLYSLSIGHLLPILDDKYVFKMFYQSHTLLYLKVNNISKMHPQSRKCLFLGFKRGTNKYIVCNLSIREVFICFHILDYFYIIHELTRQRITLSHQSSLSPSRLKYTLSIPSHTRSTTYNQIIKSLDWINAIKLTILNILLICLLASLVLVACWFIIKYKTFGLVERSKAHLVLTNSRLLFAIAAIQGWHLQQLDVNNVILHDNLYEQVYIEFSLRIVSPKSHQSQLNYSLFTKKEVDSYIILLVYVDDLILIGNSLFTIDKLIGRLFYLTSTCSNIFFVVQHLSQFMQAPTTHHYQDATSILCYIKSSSSQVIKIRLLALLLTTQLLIFVSSCHYDRKNRPLFPIHHLRLNIELYPPPHLTNEAYCFLS
ncbi:hypothetical protein CR513_22481, partial [Mucuna pruriens]